MKVNKLKLLIDFCEKVCYMLNSADKAKPVRKAGTESHGSQWIEIAGLPKGRPGFFLGFNRLLKGRNGN
jgi:hypothetical protein